MFDSDNISIVTRVEAGAGVDVTYTKNSNGESVWKAAVNTTWLNTQVDSRYSALAAATIARIEALETATGVVPAGSGGTPPTGGSNTVVVTAPTQAVSLTWNIVSVDATNIVSRDVTVSYVPGTSAGTVATAISKSINATAAALKFLNVTAVSGDTISYSWKNDAGYTLSVSNVVGTTITINVA